MQYAVVGVQFKQVGKKYFFDPNGFSPQKGDYVLVETIRGMEFGTVVIEPRLVDEEDVFLPLKPVLRIATEEDIQKHKQNKADESYAMEVCNQLITNLHRIRFIRLILFMFLNILFGCNS